MRLLVTGADGMLGTAVVESARHRTYNVFALTIDDIDITRATDVRDVVHDNTPDIIINCAAYTDVDGAEEAVALAEAVNADGARRLAAAACDCDALMVHISTDYVFDGRATQPYTESDIPAPRSAYGRSKLHGEEAVMNSGARHLLIRSCALYGAAGRNFIDTMADRATAGETVSVVTDQRTTPTAVTDVARSIFALLDSGSQGLYHVAAEGDCTWYECARTVFAAVGADPKRVRPMSSDALARPAERPAYSVLATTRFREATGMSLPLWADGVRAYLEATRRMATG